MPEYTPEEIQANRERALAIWRGKLRKMTEAHELFLAEEKKKADAELEEKRQRYWWVVTPSGDLCNVDSWAIVEHEDKTITMTLSLMVYSNPPWHGFLTKGNWQEC